MKDPFFIIGVVLLALVTADYLSTGRGFGLACGGSFALLLLGAAFVRSLLQRLKDTRLDKLEEKLKRIEVRINRNG